MSQNQLFSVRPAIENEEVTVLERCFRVEIPQAFFKGLKSGGHCRLVSQDGQKSGIGFAFPLSDKDLKGRVVRLTKAFREAYGFSLEDKVQISSTDEYWLPAQSVTVSDITDGEDSEECDPKEMEFWITRALEHLEAIVAPAVFKEDVRRHGTDVRKHTFLLESIRGQSSQSTRSPLCFDVRTTQVNFKHNESSQKAGKFTETVPLSLEISQQGIGGLQKQIQELNDRLQLLIDDLKRELLAPEVFEQGAGILLHGPSGTGKSMLLQGLSEAPGWRSVHRLGSDALYGPASQRPTIIKDAFEKAVKTQPSVILLDSLDEIAGASDSIGSMNIAVQLAGEMNKIRHEKVLVVASTISLNSVDQRLRKEGAFGQEIEIPVPDMPARIEILKTFHASDTISDAIGRRTHGYVGSDLKRLYRVAKESAYNRLKKSNSLPSISELKNMTNGTSDDPDDVNHSPSTVSRSHLLDLQLSDFEAAFSTVRPTAMKEIFLETPTVRWTDIGGSDEVREALDEVISLPFHHPNLIKTLDLPTPRGILLYGPPGCSKTLCAKAVATESDFNFLAVKGAELISMYVGESERAVREVFRKARAAAPSVIFFDEIDAIASSREGGEHTPGLNVLTTLLNEMDGIEALKGVFVLAATNRPDILDPALLRPGRFDGKIFIGPPNQEARVQILQITNRNRPLDEVDTEALAQKLEGYTGAEIVQICGDAARAVAKECIRSSGEPRIEWRHLEQAISKTRKGVSGEDVRRFREWREKRVT